jgi:hypothetical protein
MRTVIAFVFVIAVLNATGRVGTVYWNHYQLEDTVRGIVIYGGVTPTETLQQRVIEKANRLEIPLGYHNVTVSREGQTTSVDAFYRKPIEVFPRYVHEFNFELHVSALFTGSV